MHPHKAKVVQSIGSDAGLRVIHVGESFLRYTSVYVSEHSNFIVRIFTVLAVFASRWLQTSFLRQLPVDVLEEGVLLDLFVSVRTQSLLDVSLHQSRNGAFSIFTHMLWESQRSCIDVVVESGNIIAIESGFSCEALIHHQSHSIQICLFASTFLVQHLRSKVRWTSAKALRFICNVVLTQPKVGKLDVTFTV